MSEFITEINGLQFRLSDNGVVTIETESGTLITVSEFDGALNISAGQRTTEIGMQAVTPRYNNRGEVYAMRVSRIA